MPATIWLGSSELEDESKIARHLKLVGSDLDITLRIIRQNQPGKRIAIALILRAMSRAGLGKDDLVIFMDGDFVFHPGMVRKCSPLFALDPELHALTTDEHVIVQRAAVDAVVARHALRAAPPRHAVRTRSPTAC